MRNSNYTVELNTYDEKKCHVVTSVKIDSEYYDTFKKIVDVVQPILIKEDVFIKECYEDE